MGAKDCVSTLLAFILPPVAVFLQQGCGCQLLINIILTCLGWIPGTIHALCIVCVTDESDTLPVAQPAPVVVHHHHPPPSQQPPYPAGAQPGMMAPPPPGPHYPQQPQPLYDQQAPAGMYPAVPQPAPGYPTGPPQGYPTKQV